MDIERDYNTSRPILRIREYGRNVKNLVDYALTIEDKDKRTKLAYIIISVMQQVNPTDNANDEYFKKLWNHLYIISNYELEIEYPYTVSKHEETKDYIEPLGYNNNIIRYRFYGNNTELLLNNIAKEEPGEARDGLVTILANQMKEMYITWNKNIVNDELIDTHIRKITDDKLCLPEGVELISANVVLKKINSNLASMKSSSKGRGKSTSRSSGSKSYSKKPYQKGKSGGGKRPSRPR
ncbi:MAG: hypothetical protein DRI86_08655 [Bacteroidetes bacterium]|nr:MAG: hypothetical protein DRI86_08655 [Bacteroidota bacterium]